MPFRRQRIGPVAAIGCCAHGACALVALQLGKRGRQPHDVAAIDKEPLYYTDIAERFAAYNFNTVARALGHLHATERLWQDPRGKMCVRGSKFAAVLPAKK